VPDKSSSCRRLNRPQRIDRQRFIGASVGQPGRDVCVELRKLAAALDSTFVGEGEIRSTWQE
jgi:hypothetical protein